MARSPVLANILNLVDAAVEELPVERQFLNDLVASIERTEEKNLRKPTPSYKPSSLHCIRNMYYQLTGAEVKNERATSELIGICESGTDRHERIQNAIAEMSNNGIDCEYIDVQKYIEEQHQLGRLLDLEVIERQGNEVKLYNKTFNMRFLCDGIIKYKGRHYILEIKTETATKFWDRNDVNPDHVLQGTAYALNFDINKVIFLYESRDTCAKKTFMLNVTDKMKQDLAGKISECDDYISQFKVPPKPTDISKKYCGYCNYANLCKGCE